MHDNRLSISHIAYDNILYVVNTYILLHTSYPNPLPSSYVDQRRAPTVYHDVLFNKAQELLRDGLAMSSRNTYAAETLMQQDREDTYINFCKSEQESLQPQQQSTH